MALKSSRRAMLLGAASTPLVAAACAREAEEIGAFPAAFSSTELIGPVAGEARLHSNENPYGPAPSAIKGMEYAAKKGAYYADDAVKTLRSMIAERHGLTSDYITISHGSAEALAAIAMMYGQKGSILGPRLFFDAAPIYARYMGVTEIARAPMNADLSVDLASLESNVSEATGCVFLCNPNNPTGILEAPAALKAAVTRMAAKTTVVVDEAYMELTNGGEANSCIDLVSAGQNVLVARTFSKIYGMAGIRVGYVIAAPEVTKKLRFSKMSWLSGVSIAAAVGCYNDEAFLAMSRAKVLEGREMVLDTFKALGVEAKPSQTNFVFFKTGQEANTVKEALAKSDINIRGQYMDYAAWNRVSMGRLEDVERFCKALPKVLGV
ncbi:MAG: histidinol-phosphate transaminase [Pseudomonadota bacterium]